MFAIMMGFSKKKILVLCLVLIAVIGTAVYFGMDKLAEKDEVKSPSKTFANRDERAKAESNTPEGKRVYINQLEGQKKYEEAKKVAEALVEQTKKASDATILLNICRQYITNGKAECIAKAETAIAADTASLTFFEAYGSAEIFEKNGNKTAAANLYQRAYDVYPPQSQISELPIKSKEDLKKHIETLRQ